MKLSQKTCSEATFHFSVPDSLSAGEPSSLADELSVLLFVIAFVIKMLSRIIITKTTFVK